MLALFSPADCEKAASIRQHMINAGFEPHEVELAGERMDELLQMIDEKGLWDDRRSVAQDTGILVASPWGFANC